MPPLCGDRVVDAGEFDDCVAEAVLVEGGGKFWLPFGALLDVGVAGLGNWRAPAVPVARSAGSELFGVEGATYPYVCAA